MRESNLEYKCLIYAKTHNILAYKFTSPTNNGVPDRIFFKDGKTFLVEFKTKVGKLSKLQESQIKILTSQNIQVYVINDFEEFKKVIDLYL